MLLIICPDPSQKDLFDLIVAVIELIPRTDQSLGDFKLSMKNKRQILTWSTESRYTPEVQQLAPEQNWWLEDDPFLLGRGDSSGGELLNFGGVLGGSSQVVNG